MRARTGTITASTLLLLLAAGCGGGASSPADGGQGDGAPGDGAHGDGLLAPDALAGDAAANLDAPRPDAAPPTSCGSGACELGEDCVSCPSDCACLRELHVAKDAPGGCDDAWPGSVAQPLCTIQRAAQLVAAGDLVRVHEGDYSGLVVVDRSGAAGSPITFRAEGAVRTEGFVIDASHVGVKGFEIVNLRDKGLGIQVVGGGFCDLQDNHVHYCTAGGILLMGSVAEPTRTHDCLVRGNRLHRNGMFGVDVRGRDHLIEDNEVSGTIQHHPCNVTYADALWLDADAFHFHGAGHVFRSNRIHDISYGDPGWDEGAPCSLASLENPALDFTNDAHIDCFQTFQGDKGAGTGALFERNLCDNFRAIDAQAVGKAFMLEDAADLTIRNNVLRAYVGVKAVRTTGLTVVNNTFPGDVAFPSEFHPSGVSLTGAADVVLQNNLFHGLPGHTIYVDSVTGLTAGRNLSYRGDGAPPWTTNTYDHSADLWDVDPLLEDPAGGDYRLRAGSPAIDAGLDLGALVPDDLAGTARPQGGGWDIGAFERP